LGGVQLMQLDVTRVHLPPLAIHANPLLARFDADTLRYGFPKMRIQFHSFDH
jgi:hypothetical protein